MRVQVTRSRAVLVAFVVLAVEPFVYAATRSSFWQRQYWLAPVATALYLLVVGALVFGRYRWAWVLLALLYGAAIVSRVLDSSRSTTWHVFGFAINLVTFALLMSSPMRDRLRRPLRRGGSELTPADLDGNAAR